MRLSPLTLSHIFPHTALSLAFRIDNEIKDTLHRSTASCIDGTDEIAAGQRWASISLHQAFNESS